MLGKHMKICLATSGRALSWQELAEGAYRSKAETKFREQGAFLQQLVQYADVLFRAQLMPLAEWCNHHEHSTSLSAAMLAA